MTIERTLRLIAGGFVLISLGLGYWVSHYWLLFTAFVGLNLLQSGFTNWCPAMAILRWLGMPEAKMPPKNHSGLTVSPVSTRPQRFN